MAYNDMNGKQISVGDQIRYDEPPRYTIGKVVQLRPDGKLDIDVDPKDVHIPGWIMTINVRPYGSGYENDVVHYDPHPVWEPTQVAKQ